MHIQDGRGNKASLQPGDSIIFHRETNSVELIAANGTQLYFKSRDGQPRDRLKLEPWTQDRNLFVNAFRLGATPAAPKLEPMRLMDFIGCLGINFTLVENTSSRTVFRIQD